MGPFGAIEGPRIITQACIDCYPFPSSALCLLASFYPLPPSPCDPHCLPWTLCWPSPVSILDLPSFCLCLLCPVFWPQPLFLSVPISSSISSFTSQCLFSAPWRGCVCPPCAPSLAHLQKLSVKAILRVSGTWAGFLQKKGCLSCCLLSSKQL